MKTRYSNSLSEAYHQIRESAGLADKSKKSGISVGILKKVYDRGLAAYKTGHRPGTTAPQWAMARVNSFITKGSGTWGGADKDLAKQAGGKKEEMEEDFFDPITEACWAGYKQVGMKDKGGKQVPNCVPESVSEWVQVDLDEYYEIGTDEYKEYLKNLTPGETNNEQLAKIKGNTPAADGRRAATQDDIDRAEKKGDKKLVKKLKEEKKNCGCNQDPCITYGSQEEGAAADARRAISKDKDLRRGKDSADDDNDATDDDVKAASKNIMMQLRKAVSLKGRFAVEFGDGKKIKIPAKIAQEVQRKFSSIRRSQDKQKFQAKIAKSHKSMLAALRESYDTSPRNLVNLDESVIDKVKEIDKRKAAKKIDGVMVDSFTASAISQVYDKVNDKNKKRMEKLPIKKLADLAMQFIKHGEEFVPEEVKLEEGRMKELHGYIEQGKSAEWIAKKMKVDVKTIKQLMNSYIPEHANAKPHHHPHREDDELEEKKKKPVVFKGTPKQIKQQMKNLKKKDKIKIGEGDAEDRVRDKQKDQSMRDRDAKEKEIERAKVQDFRSAQRDKKSERERKQRNEVLDRVASKLKGEN